MYKRQVQLARKMPASAKASKANKHRRRASERARKNRNDPAQKWCCNETNKETRLKNHAARRRTNKKKLHSQLAIASCKQYVHVRTKLAIATVVKAVIKKHKKKRSTPNGVKARLYIATGRRSERARKNRNDPAQKWCCNETHKETRLKNHAARRTNKKKHKKEIKEGIRKQDINKARLTNTCLLYTSPSPRD